MWNITTNNDKRKHTIRYVSALLIIAFLAFCSHLIMDYMGKKTSMNAPSVEISTQQEILVQQISFSIMTLSTIGDLKEYERLRAEIFENFKLLKSNYNKMLNGDEELALFSAKSNENIYKIYTGEEYELKEKFETFTIDANLIINKDFANKDKFRERYLDFATQNKSLALSLNALSKAYLKESKTKLNHLYLSQVVVFFSTIIFLFLIGRYMFYPMITQIELEKQKLENAKRKIETILNTVGEGILVMDEDCKIVATNPEVEKIWGFAETELQQKAIPKLLVTNQHSATFLQGNLKKMLGKLTNLEGRRKNGTHFPLEVKITATTINNSRNFVIAARDITARKKAEQEVQDAKINLEKRVAERTKDLKKREQELRDINNKLIKEIHEKQQVKQALEKHTIELQQSNDDLKQFAYVASHDLKQPIRMVGSYVQLLKKRYEHRLDAQAQEFIKFAYEGSENATKLIEQLLKYACIGREKIHFQPVDLNVVILNIKENLKLQIKNNQANIHTKKMPLIRGNYIHLIRLFQNLISNAIKFKQKNVPPSIEISFQENNDTYTFAIADNGVGIQQEYKDKVFLIFHRLDKQKYEGTGIGLAICKKIIEVHQGKIWLESVPDKGTTFYFTLPKIVPNVEKKILTTNIAKKTIGRNHKSKVNTSPYLKSM